MTEPTMPAATPPTGSQPPKTEGLAIASLVCGIVGFISCGLTGIVAAILGHKANKKIARSNGALGGSGFATAGLITGYISIVVGGILGLAGLSGLAAPMILRQRKAAERAEMTAHMRMVGLSLLEFDQEYGSFPSDETVEMLIKSTGTSRSVEELTGPRVLSQLEVFGVAEFERFLTVSSLARGDWWYFGGSTAGDPGRAVLVSPELGGERVILRLDHSVHRVDPGGAQTIVEEQGEPIVIPAPRKGGGS